LTSFVGSGRVVGHSSVTQIGRRVRPSARELSSGPWGRRCWWPGFLCACAWIQRAGHAS